MWPLIAMGLAKGTLGGGWNPLTFSGGGGMPVTAAKDEDGETVADKLLKALKGRQAGSENPAAAANPGSLKPSSDFLAQAMNGMGYGGIGGLSGLGGYTGFAGGVPLLGG